jgi:hypothetical protein
MVWQEPSERSINYGRHSRPKVTNLIFYSMLALPRMAWRGSLGASARPLDSSEEAERIVTSAEDNGVTLRLVGGLAIRFHCHGPHSAHLREYHDIDVFGLSKQRGGILSVFEKLGYSPNKQFNLLYGSTRLQFVKGGRQKNVDVFLDKFEMQHTLDFRRRLRLDDLTIPITDLLLTKLQNVKLEDKDAKDIVAILEDHELGHSNDRETINLGYIADLCSRNWGLHRTITDSLDKTRKFIDQNKSRVLGAEDLTGKIEAVRSSLVTTKKGLRWRARSLIGERVKWYKEVEAGEGEA